VAKFATIAALFEPRVVGIVVFVGGLASFVALLRALLMSMASMFVLVLIEFMHFLFKLSCFMELTQLSEELDCTLHGFKMTAVGSLRLDVPVEFGWGSLEQDAYLFLLVQQARAPVGGGASFR